MIWQVTYRGKDGKQLVGEFEAENRAELFRVLSGKGISAIRVGEGQSKRMRRPRPMRPSKLMCFWVSVIVLIGIVFGMKFIIPGDEADVIKPTKESPKIISGASNVVTQSATKVESRDPEPVKEQAQDLFHGVPVVFRSAQTNENGTVIERISTADGKKHRITHPPKPVFSNPSDQLIAMAISGTDSRIGMPPLPISESVEEDFRKSLETPIEIDDSDSDEVKLAKLNVRAVRESLKELISQGMTVREALQAHQDEVNRIADYHKDALSVYNEIKASEGTEAANAFLEQVNAKFDEDGMPVIKLPSRKQD